MAVPHAPMVGTGAVLAMLALSACSSGTSLGVAPSGSASSDLASTSTVPAGRERDRGPITNSSAAPHAIPAAMVGKWGIGLADCNPATGADKGVMIVAPDSLKFFESRAQLAAVVSGDANRIRGAFAFAGEGMNWTHEEELILQSDGKSLIRRELDGDPPLAPTTYIRCPR